jgi:hypothetical protein
MCEANNISTTHLSPKAMKFDSRTFDIALDEYLNENSDTLKATFDCATKVTHKRKSENPSDILRAILTVDKENVTLSEIKDTLQINDKTYTGNNLKKYVDELTSTSRSEILRFNEDSCSYFFSNPFIKAYSQCSLRNNIRSGTISPKAFLKESRNTIEAELELARIAFSKDFEE